VSVGAAVETWLVIASLTFMGNAPEGVNWDLHRTPSRRARSVRPS